MQTGRFREDLLARIDLWTFRLPALRDRREDLEPNLRYELDKYARASGRRITFSKEAEERYLRFAADPAATWPGNFRDLNASVIRMATLSGGGRIGVETVDQEIARLQTSWCAKEGDAGDNSAAPLLRHLDRERLDRIDPFDRVQLEEVIRVCRTSRTLSEAGRRLFSASRQRKGKVNDADRRRKYLARFGLDWGTLGP